MHVTTNHALLNFALRAVQRQTLSHILDTHKCLCTSELRAEQPQSCSASSLRCISCSRFFVNEPTPPSAGAALGLGGMPNLWQVLSRWMVHEHTCRSVCWHLAAAWETGEHPVSCCCADTESCPNAPSNHYASP